MRLSRFRTARRRPPIATLPTPLRLGVVLLAAGLAAACSAAPPAPEAVAAQVGVPAETTTVVPSDDPARLAVVTSAVLFAAAPAAVLAAADDPTAQAAAAPIAEQTGTPLLLTTPDDTAGTGAELERLGVRAVHPFGPGADTWATAWAGAAGVDVAADGTPPATGELPDRGDPLVLVTDSAGPSAAAAATARASGATVAVVAGGDPRTAGEPPARGEHVLALGTAFGSVESLDYRFSVAESGVELPGGGQLLFPGRRMVALYGHPGVASMGVLGEQGVAESITRVQALAAEYQPLVDEPVVPAFEVIATVADSTPGADGDYSAEADVEFLRPWVDAAAEAGVYVVLDLQPGTTDFRTQAERYTELLAQPHVGLALDPEWRLEPGQRHLEQIGSVSAAEINDVATWLAGLTRDNGLPQKLLLLHQFRLDMITDREQLDTSFDELAVLIHADGFGPPTEKLATWDTLRQNAPDGVVWGWKNFYDEDSPTFTPQQTYEVGPPPTLFVSYQ